MPQDGRQQGARPHHRCLLKNTSQQTVWQRTVVLARSRTLDLHRMHLRHSTRMRGCSRDGGRGRACVRGQDTSHCTELPGVSADGRNTALSCGKNNTLADMVVKHFLRLPNILLPPVRGADTTSKRAEGDSSDTVMAPPKYMHSCCWPFPMARQRCGLGSAARHQAHMHRSDESQRVSCTQVRHMV